MGMLEELSSLEAKAESYLQFVQRECLKSVKPNSAITSLLSEWKLTHNMTIII